jgi:hypothetical protein
MHSAPPSPYLVPFDGSFVIDRASTAPPPGAPGKKKAEKALEREVARIDALQEKLYADNRHAVLLIFQAMDAAGKDGTIRAVLTGTNPIGFQIYSFKRPSHEELEHDFLWRTACRLPERGRIGVFNPLAECPASPHPAGPGKPESAVDRSEKRPSLPPQSSRR